MKRYVIDLDNTLCDTKKNEDGSWNYLQALPFPDRIKKLISCLKKEILL